MAFFVSTWPGRVILVIGSIIILAVAFGVIVGGLAITGGPEDCEPGGDPWDKLPDRLWRPTAYRWLERQIDALIGHLRFQYNTRLGDAPRSPIGL